MSAAVTVASIVLSVHFTRVVAGNIYRACPAFVVSAEQLGKMLNKEPEQISVLERCRFFAHCLLSS